MTKYLLATLAIAIGVSAGAAGASASPKYEAIYAGLPQWAIDAFSNDSRTH